MTTGLGEQCGGRGWFGAGRSVAQKILDRWGLPKFWLAFFNNGTCSTDNSLSEETSYQLAGSRNNYPKHIYSNLSI